MNPTIVALDLGTKCGWALSAANGIRSASTSIAAGAKQLPAQRWLKFRLLLDSLAEHADITALYFEDVKAHGPGVQAAHVYGGLVAMLELWAYHRNIPLHPVGVGTIKKHWTGKGNAKKPDMVAEAKRRGFTPRDDNEADALALLDYALCAEGEHTPTAIERPPVQVSEAAWRSPFEAVA